MATMKALEDVLAQIDRIRHIASRWSARQAVSDMERELLLDKLRALYEEVLFLDGEDSRRHEGEMVEPATAAPLADDRPSGAPVAGSAMQPQPAMQPPAEVDSSELFVQESTGEPFPEPQQGSSEPEGQPLETVVWAEQTVTTVSETTDQKLFSDEPHVRTRVDKQVILSLYGEGTPASAPRPQVGAHQAPRPEERRYEPEIGAEPTPAVSATARWDVHAQASVTQNGHVSKVLGEVIGSSAESLGDRLGKEHSHADVASKLRASTVTDLQRSIGINDRFLLINELFGGDVVRYEQILSRLNEFTALDDAMIYIQENFDWNPDSQGATFLVELLERKLEN